MSARLDKVKRTANVPGGYIYGQPGQERRTPKNTDRPKLLSRKNNSVAGKMHVNNTSPRKCDYFIDNDSLSDEEQKWCRCVLHVAANQTDECLKNVSANAYKKFGGKTCYNVYSVCSGSVGTSSRSCGVNYEFKNIPDKELVAYSKIKNLVIPNPYSRDKMIKIIMKWKKTEEESK